MMKGTHELPSVTSNVTTFLFVQYLIEATGSNIAASNPNEFANTSQTPHGPNETLAPHPTTRKITQN
jgi:hypothetical protein